MMGEQERDPIGGAEAIRIEGANRTPAGYGWTLSFSGASGNISYFQTQHDAGFENLRPAEALVSALTKIKDACGLTTEEVEAILKYTPPEPLGEYKTLEFGEEVPRKEM